MQGNSRKTKMRPHITLPRKAWAYMEFIHHNASGKKVAVSNHGKNGSKGNYERGVNFKVYPPKADLIPERRQSTIDTPKGKQGSSSHKIIIDNVHALDVQNCYEI